MSWPIFWEFFPWTVVGGLVLFWLRDRRRNRAAAEVAEKTINADVTLKEVGAEDARLVLIGKAHDTERTGLERAIEDRDRLIEWQRAELQRKDSELQHKDDELNHAQSVITHLRDQVEDLQRRLNALRRELNDLVDPDPNQKGASL